MTIIQKDGGGKALYAKRLFLMKKILHSQVGFIKQNEIK